MNTELALDLQKRINDLEESQKEILKNFSGFKIDRQLFIKSDHKMTPGIAAKVAYNQHGLIIGQESLAENDIPEMSINKIRGLRSILEQKASTVELNQRVQDIKELCKRNAKVVATGIKVNVDEHGFVVSMSGLSVEDIPTIPISKVDGLEERLELISNSRIDTKHEYDVNTTPGVACKVRYNEHGHVMGKEKLSMEDLPSEVSSRLNELQSGLADAARLVDINRITKMIVKKVEAINPIKAGTYTKVIVGTDGLVRSGSKLTVADLPELKIENISGLQSRLNNKAERSDLIPIQESISSIASTVSQLSDLKKVSIEINQKADNTAVASLRSTLNSIQNRVDQLSDIIPSNAILDQLNQITSELSTLSGKIYVIEGKLGIQ